MFFWDQLDEGLLLHCARDRLALGVLLAEVPPAAYLHFMREELGKIAALDPIGQIEEGEIVHDVEKALHELMRFELTTLEDEPDKAPLLQSGAMERGESNSGRASAKETLQETLKAEIETALRTALVQHLSNVSFNWQDALAAALKEALSQNLEVQLKTALERSLATGFRKAQ